MVGALCEVVGIGMTIKSLSDLLVIYAISRDNCYISWLASNKSGYCRIHYPINGENILHRIAWTLVNGPIPKGLCVLHKCDNPKCFRPKHLFLGTRAENNRDKTNKNRQTKGEDVNTAKLNKIQVEQIRRLRTHGFTVKELSCKFGVCPSSIYSIISYNSWR